MNKEFIPYTEALALKELGFGMSDDDYIQFTSWYDLKGTFFNNEVSISRTHNSAKGSPYGADTIDDFEAHLSTMDNSLDDVILAPLYQQAFRFFREKYDLEFTVVNAAEYGDSKEYEVNIFNEGEMSILKWYDTYEEAELACLKKLIEICQKK